MLGGKIKYSVYTKKCLFIDADRHMFKIWMDPHSISKMFSCSQIMYTLNAVLKFQINVLANLLKRILEIDLKKQLCMFFCSF